MHQGVVKKSEQIHKHTFFPRQNAAKTKPTELPLLLTVLNYYILNSKYA